MMAIMLHKEEWDPGLVSQRRKKKRALIAASEFVEAEWISRELQNLSNETDPSGKTE